MPRHHAIIDQRIDAARPSLSQNSVLSGPRPSHWPRSACRQHRLGTKSGRKFWAQSPRRQAAIGAGRRTAGAAAPGRPLIGPPQAQLRRAHSDPWTAPPGLRRLSCGRQAAQARCKKGTIKPRNIVYSARPGR
jgi:hypothetical protein